MYNSSYHLTLIEDGKTESRQTYSYNNGTIRMEGENTSIVCDVMSDKEIDDYKNGVYTKSPEEVGKGLGEELAKGILNGDEDSLDKATDLLGEDVVKNAMEASSGEEGDVPETEEASGDEKPSDSYLPDHSDGSHEDTGYYKIYAYTENGKRYTAEELDAAGVAFDLMLCPDGTGYANLVGVNYDLSWEDGYLYVFMDGKVEKMDYGMGKYMGLNQLSLTEDENDVIMSFEYAGEADSTYKWSNAGAAGAGNKAETENAGVEVTEEQESDAEEPELSYSFKGFKTTLEGGFIKKFFGTDSPDSVVRIDGENRHYFWLVDPDSGITVAEANVWDYDWNDTETDALAKDNAERLKDNYEFAGEEQIGSYKVSSVKRKKDKDSSVWRSMYLEANGHKFNVSGTFKDLDTAGKFLDLFLDSVTVEAE